jgi:hypothetical protein
MHLLLAVLLVQALAELVKNQKKNQLPAVLLISQLLLAVQVTNQLLLAVQETSKKTKRLKALPSDNFMLSDF